ncbi:chromatin assembly factor 1 subunit A-B-like [Apis laboriosa]|uniref:chromatin assembly factor 1 subunit A-B-like n=1 Tax=Apis laboriosa TaxID=183418 RepID=UPI001CC5D32B|nr:chromatin assembly factor 1 subunit A-B-like [Apis laboriosa]
MQVINESSGGEKIIDMKMMDNDGQDDCIEAITPIKKKKMKQAQLPFQMQNQIQSSNVVQSKKRKLTSPSIENNSPKTVKIFKKSLSIDIAGSKSNNTDIDTENENDIEEIEVENLKENSTSNKLKTENKCETPKQSGQKTLEKLKSSPLTKFLQKTDKQKNNSKEESQISLQEGKDDLFEKTSEKKYISNISVSETRNNLTNKIEDSPFTVNNSPNQTDSDIAILSSDEDKDEQTKSITNTIKDVTSISKNIKTPKMDKIKQKKLTPKQEEKKLLIAKRKEERQKSKMEKEKKLEEERENRRKEKEEKRKEKEEREKAEKEQKMMEKKMKEQKKQMEIEQKQKERQAKEEERRKREEAKEEEKRKKEEEKLEAERKKQKAATTFASFFVAKKQEKCIEDENTTEIKNFMPFEIKADMKIAPVCRRILEEQEKLLLDEKTNKGNTEISDLYLNEIKDKKIVPRKSFKTWPLEAKDDIILLDEENEGSSNIVNQDIVVEKQRPKLLQFSENLRPPYWGTWRKRSKNINPRRPFSKDMEYFNYEIDSDEEWEEEEPGESLHGSDDEKDEENPEDNEYDVDNDFMVPHGYLSDEELRADEEDKEDMSPETQKVRLKLLGEQFESERNTKTSKLKPKIIGIIWRGPDNNFPPNVPAKIADFLAAREAWVRQIPCSALLSTPTTSENETANERTSPSPTQQQAPSSSKKTRVPEAAIPDLIRLVHGNVHGRGFLVKEFMTYWSKRDDSNDNYISKASLLQKIRDIGKWMPCPEEGPMHSKACWYVHEEIRKKYVNEELSLPNQWLYSLIPKKKRNDNSQVVEKVEKEDKDKERKNVPLITQFTKKITQEEMKKQLTVKPNCTITSSSQTSLQSKSTSKPPKRARLISVKRGEELPKMSRENLLKDFVNMKGDDKSTTENNDSDDVIVLCAKNNENNDYQKGKGDVSDDKKESEDRLVAGHTESEGKKNDEEESSNDDDNKSIITLKSENSAENDVSNDKNVSKTVDTPMNIDSD